MPISAVLLSCRREKIPSIEEAIRRRPCSDVRSSYGGTLVVVTDTESLEEDRNEVEALANLPGVLMGHVVFSNVEDMTYAPGEKIRTIPADQEAPA
jgi:nitrate reductase NapAB chaperone NapD